MTRIGHGGNVHAAARELRRGFHRLLDFSASINPLGPSASALQAFNRALPLLRHYPDPTCWDLRQTLAVHWRRPAEEFLIGNGSTELIHLLPVALQIRHLLVVGPTFSEYATAMTRSGGRVSMVMADRADGYRPPIEDLQALLQGISRGENRRLPIDAVLLCNPNSPTGQACDAAVVRTLARQAARRGLWFLVDETFAEYCSDASILSQAPLARTIVLRSFTKFYGLPGLRVGYVTAMPRLIERVAAHQPPWSVNMPAQRAAAAALRDVRHARLSLRVMDRERARLLKGLGRLPGCSAYPSAANFILMELPVSVTAGTMVAALRREGLLIRDCSQVPGLNTRSVRVAVRTEAENNRLLKAFSGILCGGGS